MTYEAIEDDFIRLQAESMEDALRIGRLSEKIGCTTDFNDCSIEFHISQIIELI